MAACARSTPQPTIETLPTSTSPVDRQPTGVPTLAATVTPVPTATALPTPVPDTPTAVPTATPKPPHPLSVEAMRSRDYPGSDITIEQTLAPGVNYAQYLASYKSDGLKIFALLTVPNGAKPKTGWPVIVFNHGYIPPALYRTTERYIAYQAAFASTGYIVFKPDYRGNGNSEGSARGGYGNTDYTVDVLNALHSIKQYKDADPNRMGMWGHSMGGALTLRSMVTVDEIKAGVIWAGVVAPYSDILTKWRPPSTAALPQPARAWREGLIKEYGSPADNSAFWASISPNSAITNVAPIQLHHGTADGEVPLAFSQTLADQLKTSSRTFEFYTYQGDNHNLSNNLGVALQRSVAWFDKYVKSAS